MEEEGASGEGKWEARFRLNIRYDCLDWLWVPEVPNIGPHMIEWR